MNTFFFLGVGLAEYRPEVFSWVKGAIAINLDRVTAPTLRDPDARRRSPPTLSERVCATIGNVADPGPDGVPLRRRPLPLHQIRFHLGGDGLHVHPVPLR